MKIMEYVSKPAQFVLSAVFYIMVLELDIHLLLRAFIIVLAIAMSFTDWIPMSFHRRALVELSGRGYTVSRVLGLNTDNWGLHKCDSRIGSYNTVAEMLEAARDLDYQEEIIRAYEARRRLEEGGG
jgi:hypothetical protein